MSPIKDVIHNHKPTIDYRGNNNLKTIDYSKQLTTKQADSLVAQAQDLISDHKFRPFFFKTLYIIGPTAFLEAIDYARSSIDPKCRPCIFVNRLKEHRGSR